VIAGSCGGLGEMFSRDSTIIRLAMVFVGVATSILPMVAAYIDSRMDYHSSNTTTTRYNERNALILQKR
jgi:phage shock protein PspC (stress-responsive transcriptional regulator)